MARRRVHHRRVHHRRVHHRRRRVGAAKMGMGDTGMKLLATAAGFLLGGPLNTAVDKMLPKDTTTAGATGPSKNTSTVVAVGMVGVGGLLLLRKKKSSVITTIAGGVLLGAGVKRALSALGVMSGYQSVPVIGRHRMAGYQSTPVIGASRVPPQLSGVIPAQLSGYIPQGSGVGAYVPQGSGVRGVMGSIGCCDGGPGINYSDRG